MPPPDLARAGALLALLASGCLRRGEVRSDAAPDTAAAVVAGSPRRFPNPVLLDQEGRSVRFYDDLVRGRVVMVNFGYTQCNGSCPLGVAQLTAVQRLLGDRFGRDITLLTLTLDPEHDTPEVMRSYLAAHAGRPGWTWLTGRREDIDAIRRFIGFTDREPRLDADRTRHTASVLIGDDRTGRWSSVPALIRPELIVEAVLRTAGEHRAQPAATQKVCAP